MKPQKVFSIIAMLLILLLPTLLFAQPDPGDDPDAAIPVDGGLSLLFVVVAGYGVKKLRDDRRKRRSIISEKD